jgi:hypothetical protein
MLPVYRLRSGRGARQWAPVGLSLSFAAAAGAYFPSLDFSDARNSQYVPVVF